MGLEAEAQAGAGSRAVWPALAAAVAAAADVTAAAAEVTASATEEDQATVAAHWAAVVGAAAP